MTFKNLYIDHERSSEAEEWVKEELAEQEDRFAQIEVAMEALAPTREKWYQEFFDRLLTNGFNMDGDDKMTTNATFHRWIAIGCLHIFICVCCILHGGFSGTLLGSVDRMRGPAEIFLLRRRVFISRSLSPPLGLCCP